MRYLPLLLALLTACGDDDSPTDIGPDDRDQVDFAVDTAEDAPEDTAPPEDATPDDAPADAMDAADEALDAPMDAGPPIDPIDGAEEVTFVVGQYMGEDFGFLEGPHWVDGRLWFTDQFFGRPDRTAVYALTEAGAVDIIVQPSDGANGLGTNAAGDVIACLQAGRRIARIEPDSITTLFERFDGSRLNAPNDLVFREDGRWYFTDPGYGSEGAAELDTRAVYLVDDDTLTQVWRGSLEQRPNGIMLSPDESVLYLADTADGLVRAFDVEPDGTLTGERTFANVPGPDGMTIDEAGNLYVTTNSGVEAFAPDGTRWGALEVPMRAANATFGGADRRTLYITARTAVYSVRMPIAGIEGR